LYKSFDSIPDQYCKYTTSNDNVKIIGQILKDYGDSDQEYSKTFIWNQVKKAGIKVTSKVMKENGKNKRYCILSMP
jgi:hypothetical protein